MSIVAEVLFKSKATDTAHHLLMVIAAYNDLYGSAYTFPKVATLAKHINKQPRYTQKLIRRLEKDGHLHVRRAQGEESGPSLYTVLRPWRQDVPQDTPVAQNSVLQDTPVEYDIPVSQTAPVPGPPVLQDTQFFLDKEREERSGLAVPHDRVSPGTGEPSIGEDRRTTPKRTRPRNRGARVVLWIDKSKYLGPLCKRQHRHDGQDLSLRRHPSGVCDKCERERQQAKSG